MPDARTVERIPASKPLLIVSDVDGTLIDHDGVLPLPGWEMRRFIARELSQRQTPTVFALASSRSLVELQVLQRLLNLQGPLIAEDGGVLALDDATRGLVVEHIGMDAAELRERLRGLYDRPLSPVLADMDRAALADRGFGTPASVRRAIASRQASVLLDLDMLTEFDRQAFVRSASERGVQVKRGGRWCTAVSGADKGRAVLRLRQVLAGQFGQSPYVIAIGNEENDVALLTQADLPLVIRNPDRGHHPALLDVPDAFPLVAQGPAGFLEMFRIIDELTEQP